MMEGIVSVRQLHHTVSQVSTKAFISCFMNEVE